MHKIIFATDFSPVSRNILEYAARMAARTGADLVAAHALKPPSTIYDRGQEKSSAWQREHLARLETFVDVPDLVEIDIGCRIAAGSPETALAKLVKEENADVLVLAKQSRSKLERFFVGSVTERIAAVSPFPVLVVPVAGSQTTNWKPILCVTDFSHHSRRALEWGIRLAEDHGAELAVLNVLNTSSGGSGLPAATRAIRQTERDLEELVSVLGAPKGTRTLVVQGRPADTILEEADRIGSDLVVIGRRGRAQGDYVGLGSTAHSVLKRETVPLAIIP